MYLKINKETKKIVEARSSKAFPEEDGFTSAEEDVMPCCAGGEMDNGKFTPAPKPVKKPDAVLDSMMALDATAYEEPLKTIIKYIQRGK